MTLGPFFSPVSEFEGLSRALFEHMAEGVALHRLEVNEAGRPDYRILDVNPAFTVQIGLEREAVVGQLATDAYQVSEAPYYQCYAEVALSGVATRFTSYFAPLDRHFSISVVPLGEGQFATIFNDITELHQLLLRKEQSGRQFAQVFDLAPSPIAVTALDGGIVSANRGFCELTGYAKEELIGKTTIELGLWHSLEQRAVLVERLAQDRHFEQLEIDLRVRNGSVKRLEFSGSLMELDGQQVLVTAARDVTQERLAQRAVELASAEFERVFVISLDLLCVATTDGRFLRVNPAWQQLLGYPLSELLSAHFLDYVHPDDVDETMTVMSRLSEGQPVIDFVNRYRHVDGSYRYFEWRSMPYEGQLIYAAARDVTERHQAAQALAQSIAELKRSQEVARLGSYRMDVQAGTWTCSTCLHALLGITQDYPHDVGGWLALFHPEDEAELKRYLLQEVIGAGRPFEREYRIIRPQDGQTRWVHGRGELERDEAGRVLTMFGTIQDVTERQEAEQALRLSEQRFRAIAENSLDCIWTMDAAYRYTYISPAIIALRGISVEEAMSESIADSMAPASLAVVNELIASRQSARARGEVVPPEVPVFVTEQYHRNGGIVSVEIRIREIQDSLGNPLAFVGVSRDITERVKADKERLRLEEKLLQSQKLESLGVLAGGIAHDFNNLLTSILGNASLALADLSELHPIRGQLCDIETASKRAADLCRQLLAYSGKGRFVVQSISLNELVEEMGHLLSVTISKKVVLKYNFYDHLPAVLADATQLRQVIMNLITNASEAIGDRSGVVAVTTGAMFCDAAYLRGTFLGDALPPGAYAYIEVSDSGSGMDAGVLARVFDPFFTTKFTGRGLGLAAVLGIVRGHRGAIKVYSEPKRGTTFKILLPAQDEPATRLEGASKTAELRGDGLDEETVRAIARRILERAGFTVIEAADGQEAVELFRERGREVRAVVLDMTMPHLDGEACFRELRRIQPKVRVLMTSGYNEQDVIARFTGKGLAGFVQKPYTQEQLLKALLDCLVR